LRRQLDRQFLYLVAGLPMMLAVEAQFDTTLLNCRPSVVAAALLYAERRQRGAVPFWPSMLAKLTGYEDLTTPELACAVRSAQKLCRKAHYTQLYKAQSNQLAAQLMGPPPAASQPQAQLGLQLSALLGQQGVQQQQQQQQQAMGLVSGMQSDAVVAAPQLNRAPSVSLPPCGLGLQPSLSGPLSSRGLSASSAGSSSTAGVGALASLRAASGMASPAPGVLGLQGNSGSGAGLMSAMQGATTLQHNQVDLALLTQLQLQHEQQRQQQQQHQQQQQQQLSAAGLLGPASMQLGGGAGFGLDLTSSLQAAGLYGFGANGLRAGGLVAGGGDGSSLGGFAASTASPFTISLQAPVLQQAQPQEQDGLESLAMTLSALGLHGSVDDTMSTAALEVALRQQC
jgi:pentatricopeptide repeat domain-containing protein 1